VRAFALMLLAAVMMAVLGLPLLIGQALRHLIMHKPLPGLWCRNSYNHEFGIKKEA